MASKLKPPWPGIGCNLVEGGVCRCSEQESVPCQGPLGLTNKGHFVYNLAEGDGMQEAGWFSSQHWVWWATAAQGETTGT